MKSRGQRLRDVLSTQSPVCCIGTFNGVIGRAIAAHGFPLCYVSGAAVSATLGFPDIGLLTAQDVCHVIRQVVDASGLPVLADADTLFGDVTQAGRTLYQYVQAGAAGLHVEDQTRSKRCGHLAGKTIIPADDVVDKLRALCDARLGCDDPNFVLCARTDAYVEGGVAEVIRRCRLYAEAGADMVFPEGLRTLDEFREVGTALREVVVKGTTQSPWLVANMTEFGVSPVVSVQTLGDCGYHCVLFPVTTLRMSMGAVNQLLEAIKVHQQTSTCLPAMQTRRELYQLLKYDPAGTAWTYPSPMGPLAPPCEPVSPEAGPHELLLPRNTNQVLELAQYAIDFVAEGKVPQSVIDRVVMFHTDSVVCGLSAIALGTTAPRTLREEAAEVSGGCSLLGNETKTHPAKAVVANCSAVREWDANGTVFGYNTKRVTHQAGEFGHNDYYPAVVAACEQKGLGGDVAVRAMLLTDEIRATLAEAWSLKQHRIDHTLYGGIAVAIVYGALMGADAAQIESAVGQVVAHHVPWRAIRTGHQLSHSKGTSAAFIAECAVTAVHRSLRGFEGPKDIFRNPDGVFRRFTPTRVDDSTGEDTSPFDLYVTRTGGDQFRVMGMHFKLGLYEHQSAGAIEAILKVLCAHPAVVTAGESALRKITVVAYEPAFSIIGDAAKRHPKTRQSADHSMVHIIARVVRYAFQGRLEGCNNLPTAWERCMLTPMDYDATALTDESTCLIRSKVNFVHGGREYDNGYPKGIPASVRIEFVPQGGNDVVVVDSGMVLHPLGHCRSDPDDTRRVLHHKWRTLLSLSVGDPDAVLAKLSDLPTLSKEELASLYQCGPVVPHPYDDV